jgi:IS30 family transposase
VGHEDLAIIENVLLQHSMQCSLRLIARQLGRSASTVSREVSRNGGSDLYRASRSDQATWDRALRPKLCKLACRPFLSLTASTAAQRHGNQ